MRTPATVCDSSAGEANRARRRRPRWLPRDGACPRGVRRSRGGGRGGRWRVRAHPVREAPPRSRPARHRAAGHRRVRRAAPPAPAKRPTGRCCSTSSRGASAYGTRLLELAPIHFVPKDELSVAALVDLLQTRLRSQHPPGSQPAITGEGCADRPRARRGHRAPLPVTARPRGRLGRTSAVGSACGDRGRRAARSGTLMVLTGLAWLAGGVLYRGPLAHLLLAWPAGRLTWPPCAS